MRRRDDRTRGTAPPRKLLWEREFPSAFDGARGKLSRAPTLGVHESRLPEAPNATSIRVRRITVTVIAVRCYGAAPFNGVSSAPAGDLAPEGIVFVPAVPSPNKHPLLIVGNEASGPVGVFEIVLP